MGPNRQGKTTLTLHVIAERRRKRICAFVDAEHALIPIYARSLRQSQRPPDFPARHREQAPRNHDTLVLLARSTYWSFDSVAGADARAEIGSEMGDSQQDCRRG